MTHEATTCTAIEPNLPLYVGGDLDPSALDEVRAHLSVCAACRGRALAAREARRVLRSGLLRGAQGAESADLWPAISAALSRPAAPAALAGRQRPFARVASLAAGVAACLAFAAWSAHRLAREAGPVGVEAVGVEPVGAGSVDPGSPGLAEVLAPQLPEAFVSERTGPLLAEDVPAPIVPASYDPGLRRLAPGEGRLREGALPVYYAPEWLNGPRRGAGAPIQPAGLDRAVPGRSGP
jgi:anti-sigma factor RsiW